MHATPPPPPPAPGPYPGRSPQPWPTAGFLRRAERGRLPPQAEALRIAAIQGDLTTLKRLVEEGVNLEARDGPHGWTALIWAASGGKLGCLELLIAKGAKLDAISNDKWTALHQAALCGRAPCVEALLKAGADARLKNKDGDTALDVAQEWGKTQVIALLENAAAVAAQVAAARKAAAEKAAAEKAAAEKAAAERAAAKKAAKKAAAEKAAADQAAAERAAKLGLLQPLQSLALDADDLRTAIAAAVAYCDAQGAASFADLVEYDLLDGVIASLKPVHAMKLAKALKDPAFTAQETAAVMAGGQGERNAPAEWARSLQGTLQGLWSGLAITPPQRAPPQPPPAQFSSAQPSRMAPSLEERSPLCPSSS